MDKIIYFLVGLVIGLFVVFKPVERVSPPKDIKDNLEQIDSLKRLNKTDSLKAELIKRDELIINQNKALQELKKQNKILKIISTAGLITVVCLVASK